MPLGRCSLVLRIAPLMIAGIGFAPPAIAAVYVYHCVLNPRQESPPVASTAFGGGQIAIDTNANTLTYRLAFTGLAGAETATQIHGAAGPGANAGALVTLPAGNPKVGVWHYPEVNETSIIDGLTYVNICSEFASAGELRGQIVPLNALLDGAQETALPATGATGWATFTIDTTLNHLNFYVSYENLSSAEATAHIHGPALHGVNASVLFTLPAGNPKVAAWTYPQTSEAAILAGLTYVNIHSSNFPGGEIRGQIVPVVTAIEATQELASPVAPTAAGVGLIAIDTLANKLSYDVHIGGLTSAETAAHLHGYAAAGANAGVLLGLATGTRKLGTWTYPAANDTSVLGGKTYMNMHTSNNPGGEIRGQILFGQPWVVPDATGVWIQGPSVELRCSQPSPNPTSGEASIQYALSNPAHVRIGVFDLQGRMVARLVDEMRPAGPHHITWSAPGQTVATGLYFVRFETGDRSITKRLALVR